MRINNTCNNCGNHGHIFQDCQLPITSIGIVLIRFNKNKDLEYLMIRRKDSFGYVDFVRGKFYTSCLFSLQTIVDELTLDEKNRIMKDEFTQEIAQVAKNKKIEESVILKWEALRKGIEVENKQVSIQYLVENSSTKWEESEWGFPKGRRNFMEKDMECGLREFEEETGISRNKIHLFDNILPYEEVFTGSNLKSYKHKYYLAIMDSDYMNMDNFQKSEVSKMEWKTYEQCIKVIRPYNLEKKHVLEKIHKSLQDYKIIY